MQEVSRNENLLEIREVAKKLIAEQLVESPNFHIQDYRMLMLGCGIRVKMAEKPRQTAKIELKRLVKQRKKEF